MLDNWQKPELNQIVWQGEESCCDVLKLRIEGNKEDVGSKKFFFQVVVVVVVVRQIYSFSIKPGAWLVSTSLESI